MEERIMVDGRNKDQGGGRRVGRKKKKEKMALIYGNGQPGKKWRGKKREK